MAGWEEQVRALAALLREGRRNWVLTGAGISTASGIPDYRSPGTGLWEKMDPTRVASVEALLADPAAFYRANLPRWREFSRAEPNAGHLALARLEETGYIRGVITQNVDSLHRKAGSRTVYEVHGHLRSGHCLQCRHTYSFQEMGEQFDAGRIPPRCTACGGVIRPDVVLFGDLLSGDFARAEQAVRGADLLLVLGSSLTVYPVAGLPAEARRLAIVNATPTAFDGRAAVVIHEDISRVLTSLLDALNL